MTQKILAMVIGGLIHIWNPSGTSQQVTIQIGDNAPMEMLIPPLTEQILKSTATNQTAIITASEARIWIDQQDVPVEAVKPAVRWRVPVTKGTGIIIANANPNQVVIDFTINGTRLDASLAGQTTVAQFVSVLFGRDFEGTLVIESTQPIVVAAARCETVCQYLPVN